MNMEPRVNAEIKAATTDAAFREITDRETVARDNKTEMLREARLQRDAAAASSEEMATRKGGAKRTPGSKSKTKP